MKLTIPLPRLTAHLVPLALLAAIGCSKSPDYRDQRLAEMAQQTVSEQVKQNDRMADQAEAVVAESHQLAEAAKELVERDAEARRELIAAQQELTTQLNDQQSAVDAGRQQLEQDRREIAEQRHRDPIIAAAISNFGLIIACLAPLCVAGWIIHRMQAQEADHAAVAELLTLEFTSDRPRLLPSPTMQRPRITVTSGSPQPSNGHSQNTVTTILT
ncbi:MAG: hypothetical protein P1U77_29210 [Rubripirellula sp.]|nr:hypothetical protein [Rubripirellula sp.]